MLKSDEDVKLYAISIDPPDISRTLAQKIESDGKGKVGFPLLSDQDNKIIDAYCLLDPAYEGQKVYGIPHAAVYVIDKSGKVTWARVESDYRKRPTNQEVRAALDAVK